MTWGILWKLFRDDSDENEGQFEVQELLNPILTMKVNGDLERSVRGPLLLDLGNTLEIVSRRLGSK